MTLRCLCEAFHPAQMILSSTESWILLFNASEGHMRNREGLISVIFLFDRLLKCLLETSTAVAEEWC